MMTEFYQEDYRIRSVRIGEQSSLPGMEGLANVQQNTKAVLDEDDEIFLGYGFRSNRTGRRMCTRASRRSAAIAASCWKTNFCARGFCRSSADG